VWAAAACVGSTTKLLPSFRLANAQVRSCCSVLLCGWVVLGSRACCRRFWWQAGCGGYWAAAAAPAPLPLTASICTCKARANRGWVASTAPCCPLPPAGTQKHVHLECLRRWQENVQRRDAADGAPPRSRVPAWRLALPPHPVWRKAGVHCVAGVGMCGWGGKLPRPPNHLRDSTYAACLAARMPASPASPLRLACLQSGRSAAASAALCSQCPPAGPAAASSRCRRCGALPGLSASACSPLG
jgi:hypothetical protein